MSKTPQEIPIINSPGDLENAIAEAVVLRDTHVDAGNPIYTSFRDVMGAFAREAVILSPYEIPDGLVAALEQFADFIRPTFDEGFSEFKILEIERNRLRLLLEAAVNCPAIAIWNERRNGNKAPFGFASRYDGPSDPDDDFVDLGALSMNVFMSLVRKHESE